jgi:two-component system NtrC family response regulator
MCVVFDLVRKVAKTDMPVLITGETGTGKEVTARAIHEQSLRKQGPFVPINCGAIPEALLESELFGHEQGAFTGAVQRKKGRLEGVVRGTLLLDEVGDLLSSLQVKLLRFLQESTFERVGGQETLHVDARIIGATNVDLKAAIEKKRFREDLYYRLGVLQVHLPPLRERGEDMLLMAMRFLRYAADSNRRAIWGYTSEALQAIRSYHWPGNVRELSNRVRRAVIMAEGREITPHDLGLTRETTLEGGDPLDSLKVAQRRIEVEMIVKGISMHRGNLTRVARDLDVSRTTLYRKIREYNLLRLVPPVHHPVPSACPIETRA